jgi:O-antigen/teichoic acid export membrane protein
MATLGIGYALLRRLHTRPQLHWWPAQWRRVLRTALPFAATLFGLLAFDRLALFTVTAILGHTAAGWFGAGYNVVLGLTIVPGLAIMAAFPVLSRTARERRSDSRETANVATPLILFAAGSGGALAVVLALLAPVAVPLVFGDAYLPSVAVLQALALGLPGLFLVLALTSVLEATDRQHAGAAAVGAGLLIAVPLCVMATHRWGLVGAAAAYDLSYTLLAGITFVLVGRAVGWRHLWATCRDLPSMLPAARLPARTLLRLSSQGG